MPRIARHVPGGLVYHVLNRANGRLRLFKKEEDFIAFEQDSHLLTVLRYVECNPVRAKLVTRAEQWQWGSCGVRPNRKHALHPLLAKWPMDRPRRWLDRVNQPQAEDDVAVKLHIERNRPYGQPPWTQRMARMLGLEQSLRPRGRPVGWRKPAGSGGESN